MWRARRAIRGSVAAVHSRGMSDVNDEEARLLLGKLIAAAERGDAGELGRVCRAQRATITALFPLWQKPGPELRADPAAMQRFAQGLFAVARVFHEELGDPSLLERLTGPAASNPLLRWQDRLAQAQAAMSAGEYAEAERMLAATLTETHTLSGAGAEELTAVTLGCLGECHFQLGAMALAEQPMTLALEYCRRVGDVEGERVYLQNLFELWRHRGGGVEAAGFAERLAAAFERVGEDGEAEAWRRTAARVAAGEPANRLVAIIGDRRREISEIDAAAVNGPVRFVFERNRRTLRPAIAAAERGAKLGGDGQHAAALAEFLLGAAADAFDPHCRYEAAFASLHLRRYAEAAALYAEVERLAPGWFHARADLWLAEQLAAGTVAHEMFVLVHTLQDGPLPPAEKLRLADAALARGPVPPVVQLLRGKQLLRLERTAEAVAAFEAGLAMAEVDPHTRAQLQVELAARCEDEGRKAELLAAAEASTVNLLAAAVARIMRVTAR